MQIQMATENFNGRNYNYNKYILQDNWLDFSMSDRPKI